MSMIPLSQFVNRGKNIILTIKNSKGLNKECLIESERFQSKYLSFIVNPDLNCDLYQLMTTKTGGIVFKQSTEGNIRIKISPNISLESTTEAPANNYIKVSQREKKQRQWKVCERFYALEINDLKKEGN